MKKRIAVTGLGVITAIGQGIEAFWQSCLAAKTRVEKIPDPWFRYSDFRSQIWSPLPRVDYSQYHVGKIEEKQLDPSSLMAIACAFQALDSAGIPYRLIDKKRNSYTLEEIRPERAGVFMGTGIGGISSFASCYSHQVLFRQKKMLEGSISQIKGNGNAGDLERIQENLTCPRRFNPFGVSMSMPNACSANLGIKFSLSGANNTFCAACASGTVAVGYGFKAIRAGELDLALVGGVEYLYDDYGALFLGFDTVRALTSGNSDPDKANRPFDVDRSGFLFSEGGGAVLVVEELEHARKRGARIFAEILGYAETCDAFNIMMMESSGHHIERMIRQALEEAGVSTNAVDYINTHGTGTVLNDETEASLIERVFGGRALINSTKSLLGHTLGASGAIEAVVTALSLYYQTTHGCRNLDRPMRDLNFVTKVEPHPMRAAISQSFGFGGHNAVLVFGQHDSSLKTH